MCFTDPGYFYAPEPTCIPLKNFRTVDAILLKNFHDTVQHEQSSIPNPNYSSVVARAYLSKVRVHNGIVHGLEVFRKPPVSSVAPATVLTGDAGTHWTNCDPPFWTTAVPLFIAQVGWLRPKAWELSKTHLSLSSAWVGRWLTYFNLPAYCSIELSYKWPCIRYLVSFWLSNKHWWQKATFLPVQKQWRIADHEYISDEEGVALDHFLLPTFGMPNNIHNKMTVISIHTIHSENSKSVHPEYIVNTKLWMPAGPD